MSATTQTSSTKNRFEEKSVWPLNHTHVPPLASSVLGVLLAGAAVVLLRRIALGQWTSAPLGTVFWVAIVVTAVALAARWRAAAQVPTWLPTATVVAWAVACSLTGTQPVAWVIWIAAITADTYAALSLAEAKVHAAAPTAPQQGDTESFDKLSKALLADLDSDDIETGNEDDNTEKPIAEGEVVLQQVMRVRDAEGREYIYATLRGELEAGERRTTLFVGFCPPFAKPPQVEAEVIEGPPGVAKVIQSLHNGAQIEVDLDEAALEPVYVTVEAAAFEPEESGDRGPETNS